MPATDDAAAVTDTYRTLLVDVRRTAATQISRLLFAVDPARLQSELTAWEAAAGVLGAAAAASTRRLTTAWLTAYTRASGLDTPPPAPDIDIPRPNYHIATVAVWWRLAAGAGRTRALQTGAAEATRLAADQVIDTANTLTVAVTSQDDRIVGYRRVSSTTTCGACLALHGQLVTTTSRPYDRHGHCRCTAEPVFADLPEAAPRPTGQQRWDQMSPADRARLFSGRGGADKAALVGSRGLDVLIDRAGPGRIRETPLSDLETP